MGSPHADQAINLDCFQEEFFRRAVERHVEEYVAHFGERLVAIYLSGSAHRNEAVPGVSDLDVHSFMRDERREEDNEWWRRAGEAMDREFGTLYGICRPRTVNEEWRQRLQAPSLERYSIVVDPADGTRRLEPTPEERTAVLARSYGLLLRYDATRDWGRDLLDGLTIPPPDRAWARVALLSPWELVRFAAGQTRENRTDFDLPDDLGLRLRYFAKLAIYTGASLLMARGEFRSYRGADVLPALVAVRPEWAPFLEQTRELYLRPVADAAERLSGYLERLIAWMGEVGEELDLPANFRRAVLGFGLWSRGDS